MGNGKLNFEIENILQKMLVISVEFFFEKTMGKV